MSNSDLIYDGRLPFILNTIGEMSRQIAMFRDPGPAWEQFLWVKSGDGSVSIAGDSFTLSGGEGMFMRSVIPHSYRPLSEHWHTCYCTFFCAPSLVDYCIGDKPYVRFNVPDFLHRETEMLCGLAKKSSSLLERSSAGYAYVTRLFGAITKDEDSVIVLAREFMEKSCHLQISLDDVAASVGMDRFSVCRYFRKHGTRSVMDELRHIRIKKAKRLLSYSSDSVEAIGRACGFESPSYFAMKFREECGQSPSEYRLARM